jgi:uncharacterized protein (UPF0335 family)
VRSSLQRRLLNLLNDNDNFVDSDFTMSPVETLGETYRIEYRWGSGEHLELTLPEGPTEKFFVRSHPGTYQQTESFQCSGKELDRVVRGWLARLREDIASHPFVRQVDRLDEAIAEIDRRLKDVTDEPLGESEVDALRKQLDGLQARFEEKLSEQDSAIAELSKTISILKSRLEPGVSKRRWYQQAGSMMLRLSQVPILRTLVAGTLKSTLELPDGIEDIVDAMSDDDFRPPAQLPAPRHERPATEHDDED